MYVLTHILKTHARQALRARSGEHFILATLLLGSLLLIGCGGEEEASEPSIRPVRTAQAVEADAHRMRAFSGQTQAPTASTLSFRVQGTIEQRPVRVGQVLQKGDLVAALDATDYRIEVQEARAALMEVRARAQNAEADYERIRGLYANDLISRSEFDQAQTARETAQASTEAARQRLGLTQQRLRYTRLYAPETGAVAEVPVDVGENVRAGEPVALLTAGDELEVEISMPEGLIGQLAEGDDATVSLPAFPDTTFQAVVTEVGVAPRASATAYPVIVQLQNAPPRMRPGMAARVAFAFESLTTGGHPLVPPAAVGQDTEGTFVFVFEPMKRGSDASSDLTNAAPASGRHPADGVARRRAVNAGAITPQGMEIVQGLSAGERVVTAGVDQLTDGQRVRLLDEQGGSTSSATIAQKQ